MIAWIESLPLGLSVGFFWTLAVLRSLLVFGLGRAAAAGAERSRVRRVLDGPGYARARVFADRFGPWAIPLCYLTIGLQTAVIVSAGAARMRWRRFLPAMAVGTFVWGLVYGTVGMAIVWAVLGAAVGEPWAWALLAAAAGALLVILVRRRALRRRGRRAGLSRSV
ncbi:membrane protein DedA with SNARE-associated domain [Micrococcus cohnii]|uniref:Membrane protein DedA with SNARE-associated domain n=1 Tax=Micrococcus cohnii TaxID=993416 RepID=A0A7W7GPN7_9MICC|nr:membrane protein DedA with SNARE-associated domain [Micrococcus cohnii]